MSERAMSQEYLTESVRAVIDETHDVLNNFDALLRGVNFTNELHMLGIGRWNIFERRAMLLELHALYIAMWHKALTRSFPDTAEHIFAAFLERHTSRTPQNTHERHLLERIHQYKDFLHTIGDRDFTAVSRHLLTLRRVEEHTLKPRVLRLALHLRAIYTLIFDRLI